jgi:hypothetical protein
MKHLLLHYCTAAAAAAADAVVAAAELRHCERKRQFYSCCSPPQLLLYDVVYILNSADRWFPAGRAPMRSGVSESIPALRMSPRKSRADSACCDHNMNTMHRLH